MDLRALTSAKRYFRRFASVERAAFARMIADQLGLDEQDGHALIDDLIDGGYVFQREVAQKAVLTPGPNLESGVLALVGVTIPPH